MSGNKFEGLHAVEGCHCRLARQCDSQILLKFMVMFAAKKLRLSIFSTQIECPSAIALSDKPTVAPFNSGASLRTYPNHFVRRSLIKIRCRSWRSLLCAFAALREHRPCCCRVVARTSPCPWSLVLRLPSLLLLGNHLPFPKLNAYSPPAPPSTPAGSPSPCNTTHPQSRDPHDYPAPPSDRLAPSTCCARSR